MNFRLKFKIQVSFIIFFALLLLGSLLSANSAYSQNPAAKFKVGMILPLSGPLAEYGLAAQNGIELAKKQKPDLFTNIDFIYQDSQWDAKTAVSAFNMLRDVEQVSLVFNWGNPTSEAIAPIAEHSSLPLIAMTLDPKTAEGKHFVIRSINPANDFAVKLADQLRTKKYKNIGFVIAQNTYVQGLFNGIKNNLNPDQQVQIIEEYPLNATDFRDSIAKIRSKHLDALGVFLISGQISTFYRQLAGQKINIPTFGTDFFESGTEIKLAQGGMEDAVYTHLDVSANFEADYVKHYGTDYQLAYAGNAYDMAVLVGSLFNSLTRTLSPNEIMSELTGPKASMTGVGGDFDYIHTAKGDSYYKFPIALKVIRQGKFKTSQE